eukprot:COSAG05_NODE_1644_length_4351_cov_343.181091_7_plen_54_part_00
MAVEGPSKVVYPPVRITKKPAIASAPRPNSSWYYQLELDIVIQGEVYKSCCKQ